MVDADHEEDDGQSDGGQPAPGAQSRRSAVVVVWSLVIAAAVVLTMLGVKGVDLYHARRDQSRDAQVLDVTREVVAGLVSLDYKRSKADLDRISAVATGSFQKQFGQLATSFEQVLASGEVRSTGAVKEAGIVEADDDSAKVLAAVSSVVKNTEAPDGQQRVYRMLVDLERQGDDWKVGNVEFVS
ncbi:hypothetical protein GSI01S_18_00210 [Gordonia sihwensis NBRC 108236]|uniref:Uncharacterized protein n=1 Tax=Gordonia sihwensis NBRC 108236 TaxID=1223544 RepID=L7LL64_9ACTN|nr:hypothetical protein GSI01S_18_00210 [Gordonia sihwensis NBRC 108236]